MCEQTQYGFDCVCEHVREYPGENWYTCEWCGLYQASRPRCNQCEDSDRETLLVDPQPAGKEGHLEAALKRSNQALNDWLVYYAPEQHSATTIASAARRIFESGGTLAYVADVLKQNREALGEE